MRPKKALPATSVLGFVRLEEVPVWDLQCCEGHQTTAPDVHTVWLPHAPRPISLAVLQSFWGSTDQGVVPSYDLLMTTLVCRIADRVGPAAALTRFLTCPEWKEALAESLASPNFAIVAERVLRDGPCPENIFTAFNATPLSRVRVVVLGQRPYSGTVELPSQLNNGCTVTTPRAQGLSFSVPRGAPLPDSLRNIYTELQSNFSIWVTPHHGNLEAWTEQGILLLNAALTVEHEQEWHGFTDEVIKVISMKCKGVVFLLLGGESKMIDTSKHTIVKPNSDFSGSRCFIAVNRALVKHGHKPLDWHV